MHKRGGNQEVCACLINSSSLSLSLSHSLSSLPELIRRGKSQRDCVGRKEEREEGTREGLKKKKMGP